MDSKSQASVQELRTIFTKSQLAGPHQSSQESLDSLSDQFSAEKSEIESEGSSHNAEKEIPFKRALSKPTISPKPTSLAPGSKPAIKNLVAALEGSHGMYTTKNLPGRHGITVTDVRESSKNYKSPEKITQFTTSKLVKKETITLKEQDDDEKEFKKSSLSSSSDTSSTQDVSMKENIDSIGNDIAHVQGIEKSASDLQVSSTDGYDRPKKLVRESIISVDNYVSKPKGGFVRRVIPSKEELGPAPPKPPKPEEMRLPLKETSNYNCSTSLHSSSGDSLPPPVPNRNPDLSPKPPARVPPKPPRSLPKEPLPDIPSPIPPDTSEYAYDEDNEEEEIYNDVIFTTDPSSPSCSGADGTICPDDDDIYDDHSPHFSHPSLPRYPPPLPPSTSHLHPHDNVSPHFSALSTNSNESSENEDTDAIYEETPVGPEYVNAEEVDKEKKKQKKRSLKTEQKTLEKIEKKREKFMKKFMLSGEEIPLDAGTVKSDAKGNKFDLSVIKGETVLILRMENNPSGKWLVKNGKGRVGYVELTNIQVDVESVKSVMVARTSQILMDD